MTAYLSPYLDAPSAGLVLDSVKRDHQNRAVDRVQRAVAAEFKVSLFNLRSARRNPEFAYPRFVAMFLCRDLLKMKLQEIAAAFNKKDHGSVCNGLERVTERSTIDPDFVRQIANVREALKREEEAGK